MHVQIVTPQGAKVEADVSQLTAPGEAGDLGLLPGHRPLLTSLGVGTLSYTRVGGSTQYLAVNGGYLEIDRDDIIVITETAEAPDEIDVARAKRALDRARAELREVDLGRPEELARIQAAVRRAESRLIVATLLKPSIPT
jgi:F-type H+-transporting ATPase subunit epsilon